MNDTTATGSPAPIRHPNCETLNRLGGCPGSPCGRAAVGVVVHRRPDAGGSRRVGRHVAEGGAAASGPRKWFRNFFSRLARTGLALRSDRQAVARESGLTGGSETTSRLRLTGAIGLRAAAFGRGGGGPRRGLETALNRKGREERKERPCLCFSREGLAVYVRRFGWLSLFAFSLSRSPWPFPFALLASFAVPAVAVLRYSGTQVLRHSPLPPCHSGRPQLMVCLRLATTRIHLSERNFGASAEKT